MLYNTEITGLCIWIPKLIKTHGHEKKIEFFMKSIKYLTTVELELHYSFPDVRISNIETVGTPSVTRNERKML